MDFARLIEQKKRRFQELETQITSGSLFTNPKQAKEIMREHARVRQLLDTWEQLERSQKQLADNRAIAAAGDP